MPNWLFDVICVEGPAGAMQIVIPSSEDRWFDHDELFSSAVERHGVAGNTCGDCGEWKWMPLGFGYGLPGLNYDPAADGADAIASSEWFGDGAKAFRQILVRREMAELVVAASPRAAMVASSRL